MSSLFFQPNKNFRDRFSLSGREIVCLVSTFPSIDIRAISEARLIIEHANDRLEPAFVFIVSKAEDAESVIANLTAGDIATFATYSFSEIRFLLHNPSDCIPSIARRAASKDLYNIRSALKRSRDFFGRKSLLAKIQHELIHLGSSFGLFGLRKVGKTSFLYQLIEHSRAVGKVCVAHLDFQLLDAVARTSHRASLTEYFLWAVGQAVWDALPSRKRSIAFSLIGLHSSFNEAAERSRGIAELLLADLRLLLTERIERLVIAIDEIDLMLTRNGPNIWRPHFVSIWRFLRGLAQQQQAGSIAFFLTGTSPHFLEVSSIDGEDNPLLAWVSKEFIGSLERDEAATLLGKIGERMGMNWSQEALDFVWSRVAGHPLLTRLFGSSVHSILRDRTGSVDVAEHHARQALPLLTLAAAPTLSQILELMRENYPDEYELLRLIAMGEFELFSQYYQAFPEDAAHLIGYGLLSFHQQTPTIPLALVEEWIRRRESTRPIIPSPRRRSSDAKLPSIDGYEVLRPIGKPGGFAEVFRARSMVGNALVAIKVYSEVSLSRIEREIEAMGWVNHPNIVQIIDYGKTSDGRPYLVMELLEGRSLDEFVNPADRLSSNELIDVARGILSALVALHPDPVEVAKLAAKQELTTEDLARFQRARLGYIHRDLKPQNIMLVSGRGPVIIDFNISVMSGTPVSTVSQTPGYLPEALQDVWDPRVDLFALGITLAQVGSGMQLRDAGQEAKDNILRALAGTISFPVADFIRRLSPTDGSYMYNTAREAMAALEACRDSGS